MYINLYIHIKSTRDFLRTDLVLRKNKDITVQLCNIDFTNPFEAGILAVHTLKLLVLLQNNYPKSNFR